ncbi:MAG: PAS domain-containing sensor histidine kinase [Chryseolinea sp.]
MFQALVENSNDVIIVTDRDFKVRYISSSVVNVLGIEPMSGVGKDIFDFLKSDKVNSWKQRLKDSTSSFIEEISLQVKGERAYFDASISNLFDQHTVQGLVVKLHDITGKKQRERELIRSNQHLDQVIYKTTHDLKAPLMSALGLVQIAEDAPDVEKGQYITMIKKSLLSLDGYIDEMNSFFRIDKLAIHREKISLEYILSEIQENLRNFSNGTRVRVDFKINDTIAWFSDQLRVKTIITNIFSNAIKYQDSEKKNPFIKIIAIVTDEYCDIVVEDNGIGIEPEFQGKIFDLFFRGTTQAQGTGLGLSIVKDTIERLKGSVQVKSTVNKGTTFFIRIPNQLHQPLAVA